MSSQVITTLPGTTNDYSNSKNPSDSPISSETEIEPGKQKNFYRQVSGAGDGLPSQTTADFGPKGLSKIVKMQENNGDSVESGIGDVGEALPISEESNVLQGQSWQTGFFELALRDRNMEVRLFWKVLKILRLEKFC